MSEQTIQKKALESLKLEAEGLVVFLGDPDWLKGGVPQSFCERIANLNALTSWFLGKHEQMRNEETPIPRYANFVDPKEIVDAFVRDDQGYIYYIKRITGETRVFQAAGVLNAGTMVRKGRHGIELLPPTAREKVEVIQTELFGIKEPILWMTPYVPGGPFPL